MIRGKDKKVFSIHRNSKEKKIKEINYSKAKAKKKNIQFQSLSDAFGSFDEICGAISAKASLGITCRLPRG
jgi:hypothetical protein